MNAVARAVVQFALLYAGLTWLASVAPVYPAIERALAALAGAALGPFEAEGEHRSLRIESPDGTAVYRFDVEIDGRRRILGGPIRLHGFVPLLFVALVLATPGLSWKRRGISLVVGTGACMLLATGMLMNYLQVLERAAFPGSDGPYPQAISWLDAVGRTAAGGLLPLVLWAFAAGPHLRGAQTARAGGPGGPEGLSSGPGAAPSGRPRSTSGE